MADPEVVDALGPAGLPTSGPVKLFHATSRSTRSWRSRSTHNLFFERTTQSSVDNSDLVYAFDPVGGCPEREPVS